MVQLDKITAVVFRFADILHAEYTLTRKEYANKKKRRSQDLEGIKRCNFR